MKRARIFLCFTVLVAICLFGINTNAMAKTIELSFNHLWGPTSGQTALFQQWADRISEGTNGKVKINQYPGSTLVRPPEMWDGLKSGACDIASCFSVYHRGAFPFYKAQVYFWIGAPGIEFAVKELGKLEKKYPVLVDEYKDAKVLWISAQGPRKLLVSDKPVRTMADFKGLKLRAAVPPEAELVKELGATAPPWVPMGQVYPSIQKKIFDGLWVSTEVLKSFRLAEVIKYVSTANLEVGIGKYVAMNWDSWNKLPDDVKAVFEKESEWGKQQDIKLWIEADKEGEAFAKEMGTEFINFPEAEYRKFMSLVKPIQDNIAKEMDKKGYPGSALLKDVREAIANAKN